MLMLLFPYDAHLLVILVVAGVYLARRPGRRTMRRLRHLVRQDRLQMRGRLGL